MSRSALLCTRFPTPCKGAGATDRQTTLNNLGTLPTVLGTLVLLALAGWKGGAMNLMCAVAIELGVHFLITVGSRVESRTLLL